jgi:hypothetical protein
MSGHGWIAGLPHQPCGRCLSIQDVRSSVVVRWDTGSEAFPDPTHLPGLRAWVVEQIDQGRHIELNAMARAFRPVATWHGDTVCEVHLWEAADAERRARWGPGPRR